MENLKVYVVTYNVGTNNPEQDLLALLSLSSGIKHEKNLPDFYVISLQEVRSQPQDLLMSALSYDPWTKAFRNILGEKDYIMIKSIRLQGLILSLYCLRKHLLNVRDVESDYTRTGLSGMWGNKGAVSIRLSIYGCSICFVNAHLSAHDHMLKARVEDYNSIIKDQKFHVNEHDEIFFHDYVFWMGDLNFRILEEYEKSPEEIVRMIEKGDFESLIRFDQLLYVMRKGEAFHELEEQKPDFPPTFKFEVESADYDLKRRPAWTDRILFKVNPYNYDNVKLKIQQHSYKSHPQYTLSDHKPVTSDFTIKIPDSIKADSFKTRGVQVFADYGEEVVQFHDIEYWWADEENTVQYRVTKEITKTKEDWIGVFKDNFYSLDDYITYEYVYKNESPVPTPRNLANAMGPLQAKEYTIKFSEIDLKPCNQLYRLIYFSETEDKVTSVLGMSNPFPLRQKLN